MEGGLHKAFVDELRDAYDAEKQLLKALPKLAKAATAEPLKAAFTEHLEQTRGQIERLEQVFASIEERARGKHCDGIAGIIEEGQSVMEEDLDPATMDACLIAAGQRSEHYEIAAYGTLVAWANVMGHTEAARLLDSILEEEKATDAKLNTLAEGGINRQAASSGQADAEGDEGRNAALGRGAAGPAASSRKSASSKSSRKTASSKKSGRSGSAKKTSSKKGRAAKRR